MCGYGVGFLVVIFVGTKDVPGSKCSSVSQMQPFVAKYIHKKFQKRIQEQEKERLVRNKWLETV